MKIQNAKHRMVQAGFHAFVQLLKRDNPTPVNKPGAITAVPEYLKADGISRVMIFTDEGLVRAGIIDKVQALIKAADIEVEIYDKVIANPTTDHVLDCAKAIKAYQPQCLLAIGGGSSMDTAKVAMALSAMPKPCSVAKLAGNSQVTPKVKHCNLPRLYVVPTTAGTGSEATTVAAMSDPVTHEKFTITDDILLPKMIFLDAELMLGLPASVSAATGFDALTHCVEAYLNVFYGNKTTDELALRAVYLIMKNLKKTVEDGSDLKARHAMLNGSYMAGLAFSTAAVGYGHSFAHASAAVFDQYPHGMLTSIMLPDLLEYYLDVSKHKLAKMARICKVTSDTRTIEDQAQDFIKAVKQLRADVGLPAKLPAVSELDLELICERSLKEANPIYPVPKIMDMEDARAFMRTVTEEN